MYMYYHSTPGIICSLFICCVSLHSYSSAQPQLTEEEQVELHKRRVDKSRFVQELLLSTLAFSDSSSEGEDT